MNKPNYLFKERKPHTIRCKRCGEKREVLAANYKQVEFCKSCYYDIKREYNTEYIRRKREEKAKELLKPTKKRTYVKKTRKV